MRSTYSFLVQSMVCLALILAGCGSAAPSAAPKAAKQTDAGTAADYFSAAADTLYHYQGAGSEYASCDVYNDYIEGNRIQQRVDNGGAVTVRILALSDGRLTETRLRGERRYREKNLDQSGEEEILLREPLVKGTAWILPDGRKRTITAVSVPVSTPSGRYSALEVTTAGEAGQETVQYYAKGVGLIQTNWSLAGERVSSTLGAVRKNAPMTQTVRFFYPDQAQKQIWYVDREVPFYTNDVTEEILTGAYRQVPQGAAAVLTDGMSVTGLHLREDGKVLLDLTRAPQEETGDLALRCLVNTFGFYYQTDQVILSAAGRTYGEPSAPGQEASLETDLIGTVEVYA